MVFLLELLGKEFTAGNEEHELNIDPVCKKEVNHLSNTFMLFWIPAFNLFEGFAA